MTGVDATEMFNAAHPADRHAQPEEIARCRRSTSPPTVSSFVTGTTLMVDGGMRG